MPSVLEGDFLSADLSQVGIIVPALVVSTLPERVRGHSFFFSFKSSKWIVENVQHIPHCPYVIHNHSTSVLRHPHHLYGFHSLRTQPYYIFHNLSASSSVSPRFPQPLYVFHNHFTFYTTSTSFTPSFTTSTSFTTCSSFTTSKSFTPFLHSQPLCLLQLYFYGLPVTSIKSVRLSQCLSIFPSSLPQALHVFHKFFTPFTTSTAFTTSLHYPQPLHLPQLCIAHGSSRLYNLDTTFTTCRCLHFVYLHVKRGCGTII